MNPSPPPSSPSGSVTAVRRGSLLLVSGDVDEATAAAFERHLADALAQGDIEDVDLTGVRFFGSAGVDPLMVFSHQFRGHIATSRAVELTLRTLGLALAAPDARSIEGGRPDDR